MTISGGCHCGAIRYRIAGDALTQALCHCSDCRRHAGTPLVGWAMFKSDQVQVTQGEARIYASSENGRRHFCADCGTGLFYVNERTLPGLIDVQTGTLDDPALLPAQLHIQTAERIPWMDTAHDLPRHERYPG